MHIHCVIVTDDKYFLNGLSTYIESLSHNNTSIIIDFCSLERFFLLGHFLFGEATKVLSAPDTDWALRKIPGLKKIKKGGSDIAVINKLISEGYATYNGNISNGIPLIESIFRLFTRAELRILKLLIKGWDVSKIANYMNCGAKTTYTHIRTIKNKLECENNLELHLIMELYVRHFDLNRGVSMGR